MTLRESPPFQPSLTRRTLLRAAPATLAIGLSSAGSVAAAREVDPPETSETPDTADTPDLYSAFPTQDPAVVRETVGVSHANFDRLKELVSARPELANAAWDWGFGDWETALGAASHMGRRDIAGYLMENGARPDIFTAAMFGDLTTVESMIATSPGIQSRRGPHGITLLAHARSGGDQAAKVSSYLEDLGDADPKYTDIPLTESQRETYLGTFRFGEGERDFFLVDVNRRGLLAIRRGTDFARALFHQGDHEFHPPGAPSARFRFAIGEGNAAAIEVRNPDLVLTARRTSA